MIGICASKLPWTAFPLFLLVEKIKKQKFSLCNGQFLMSTTTSVISTHVIDDQRTYYKSANICIFGEGIPWPNPRNGDKSWQWLGLRVTKLSQLRKRLIVVRATVCAITPHNIPIQSPCTIHPSIRTRELEELSAVSSHPFCIHDPKPKTKSHCPSAPPLYGIKYQSCTHIELCLGFKV